jgi:hypothetical protein
MRFILFVHIGFGMSENSSEDVKRVEYLSGYLDSLATAIRYWHA